MSRFGMLLLTAGLTVTLNCNNPAVTGNGGSSETVNAQVAITDTLVTVTTAPPATDELALLSFSISFHPFEKTGFRDSVGATSSEPLQWKAPATGRYNLLLRSGRTGTACFLCNVMLEHGISDTLDCTLGSCTDLSGSLTTPDSSVISEIHVLSIYGSPFWTLSDSTGHFTMNAVPQGQYTVSIRSTAKRLFVSTSNYTIVTDDIDPSTWLRLLIR